MLVVHKSVSGSDVPVLYSWSPLSGQQWKLSSAVQKDLKGRNENEGQLEAKPGTRKLACFLIG